MAFNYISTDPQCQHPYHISVQLIQQMDLSALYLSSNTELSSLVNATSFPHCDQIMSSAAMEQGGSGNRTMACDFNPSQRTSNTACMPVMTDTVSVHTADENYGQSFQHNHGVIPSLLESCHSGQSTDTAVVTGVSSKDDHQLDGIKEISETCTSLPKPYEARCIKNTKSREKKKNHVRVRRVKPGCSNDCQRRCKQKLSHNTREDLFNEYWSLADDSKRKEFIARHAIKLPMMTSREGSRRRFSVDWAFSVQDESFSVCKLFFLDTLDISEEMAYSAIKKSTFFGGDVSVTQKKTTRKSAWFETDIDDYSERKSIVCSQRKPKYESKKEKISEMRPGCTDSCRRNCQSKFTYKDKMSIFSGYRSLSNIRKQREFIKKHVRRLQRKYAKSDKITRRGCSVEWLLPVKGENIPVCKTFFLHTVGISEHTAYSIGLQNEMQPVEKRRSSEKVHYLPLWSLIRNKYLKALITKGKLKSALTANWEDCGESHTGFSRGCISASKLRKGENVCGGSEIKRTAVNSDQPHLVVPSNKLMTGICLQNDSFSSQCPPRATRHEDHYSLALSEPSIQGVSFFSHQIPSSGNSTMAECTSQTVNVHGKSSHPQENQNSSPVIVSSVLQAAIDDLPLQNGINATNDFFCCNHMKRAIKQNKSQASKQENHRKVSKTKREKILSTKKVREGCSETCRRKCSQKIPHVAREELFDEFWQLESDVGRREFILPIVNKIPKKSNKNSYSRRGCTIEWTIPYNGEFHIVCKKFFLDTFDITENFVKTIHSKIEYNDGSMEDMRGKHGKRSAVFVQEEKEIEKHIKSYVVYKAVRCARCSKDFPRWCLEKMIPLSQLYKEYTEMRKVLGVKPACRTSFTAICAKKFQIIHNSAPENVCDKCVHMSPTTSTSIPASAVF